jgi:dTDP-glucose 4,6-dehydratase
LLSLLGKPESLITYVKDRLGHDRRYAMDITRIRDRLGWRPSRNFEQGLRETVEWYRTNEEWWRRVRSEAYKVSESLHPGAA